jgi:DNA-binding transcriptional regulator YhcF (GntR family)
LSFDFHCRLAISHQVADHRRASVVAVRADLPRDPLPAQRSRARSAGVNPNAVQKPFDEFEQRELIVPVDGSLRPLGRITSDSLAMSGETGSPVGAAA